QPIAQLGEKHSHGVEGLAVLGQELLAAGGQRAHSKVICTLGGAVLEPYSGGGAKPSSGKLGTGCPPVDLLDVRVGAASGFQLLIHGLPLTDPSMLGTPPHGCVSRNTMIAKLSR